MLTKVYLTLDKLQKDLDDFIIIIKEHIKVKYACGRSTPIETLLDGKRIWKEKVENLNLN